MSETASRKKFKNQWKKAVSLAERAPFCATTTSCLIFAQWIVTIQKNRLRIFYSKINFTSNTNWHKEVQSYYNKRQVIKIHKSPHKRVVICVSKDYVKYINIHKSYERQQVTDVMVHARLCIEKPSETRTLWQQTTECMSLKHSENKSTKSYEW